MQGRPGNRLAFYHAGKKYKMQTAPWPNVGWLAWVLRLPLLPNLAHARADLEAWHFLKPVLAHIALNLRGPAGPIDYI